MKTQLETSWFTAAGWCMWDWLKWQRVHDNEKNVTVCKSAAHWCVFNSYCRTMELTSDCQYAHKTCLQDFFKIYLRQFISVYYTVYFIIVTDLSPLDTGSANSSPLKHEAYLRSFLTQYLITCAWLTICFMPLSTLNNEITALALCWNVVFSIQWESQPAKQAAEICDITANQPMHNSSQLLRGLYCSLPHPESHTMIHTIHWTVIPPI